LTRLPEKISVKPLVAAIKTTLKRKQNFQN
jgi:hypothetical protein